MARHANFHKDAYLCCSNVTDSNTFIQILILEKKQWGGRDRGGYFFLFFYQLRKVGDRSFVETAGVAVMPRQGAVLGKPYLPARPGQWPGRNRLTY